MKVALVHDYIKEYGGAERVLEALHEIWPTSPVYTTVYLPEFLGPHKERFKNWDIRTSFLQYIPFKEKLISPFRIVAPFMFRSFNLSQFDVVIVSATGAYTPNMIRCHPELSNRHAEQVLASPAEKRSRNKFGMTVERVRNDIGERPIHICYCHTPPRYLYGYATARNWKKSIILGSIGKFFNHFLRLVDFRSVQNVDYFVANSENVAGRIKKFYRRNSRVIYPPVHPHPRPLPLRERVGERGYFLAGGRLARPKHIDLIVRACRELNVNLKIFGRGFAGYNEELNQELGIKNQAVRKNKTDDSLSMIHNSKVEFVGEVSEEEKLKLMRNARAYIFAAEDEDFGITPVEAMSVGTPVIAYRSGGVVESIIDEKTGIFFDELAVENLSRSIKRFNRATINPNDCIKQAGKFSKERFKKEIKEFVESIGVKLM